MSSLGKSIDWPDKLRRFLQTEAFCLVIAALHWTLMPERPFTISLVYSSSIGFFSWALIDFGRHLFPSARQTGWPPGWPWCRSASPGATCSGPPRATPGSAGPRGARGTRA